VIEDGVVRASDMQGRSLGTQVLKPGENRIR
jgi:hypothetical protein